MQSITQDYMPPDEVHKAWNEHQIKIEEWLQVRIKPKPAGWPKWYWEHMLNKLIYLVRSGIKFDINNEDWRNNEKV